MGKKVATALQAGLHPLFCVGESLPERDENRVEEVLERQLGKGLGDCSPQVVIAYEPVWAIGTGRTATAAQAQEAHAFIRSMIASAFGPAAAKSIRIQYGGSVTPENAQALMRQKDVDGALVGGASLDPRSFAQIVRSASKKDSWDNFMVTRGVFG